MTYTFFGSDRNSVLVLSCLHQAGFPLRIVTDSSGNNPLIQFANEYNLPFISYDNLSNLPTSPDEIGILASFGRILPAKVIHRFPQGILCLHPSLLPQYRGATPVPTAIALGDTTTGITLFKLSEKVDQGTILSQATEPILPTDTSPELLTRLFSNGSDLLTSYLSGNSDIQTYQFSEFSEFSELIFTRRFTRQSGYLEWPVLTKILSGSLPNPSNTENSLLRLRLSHNLPKDPLQGLHDLHRALLPWPGVWTNAPGKKGDLRLVLTSVLPTVTVQLPGKPNPIIWDDFSLYYL